MQWLLVQYKLCSEDELHSVFEASPDLAKHKEELSQEYVQRENLAKDDADTTWQEFLESQRLLLAGPLLIFTSIRWTVTSSKSSTKANRYKPLISVATTGRDDNYVSWVNSSSDKAIQKLSWL